jgi:hypothetical protein
LNPLRRLPLPALGPIDCNSGATVTAIWISDISVANSTDCPLPTNLIETVTYGGERSQLAVFWLGESLIFFFINPDFRGFSALK